MSISRSLLTAIVISIADNTAPECENASTRKFIPIKFTITITLTSFTLTLTITLTLTSFTLTSFTLTLTLKLVLLSHLRTIELNVNIYIYMVYHSINVCSATQHLRYSVSMELKEFVIFQFFRCIYVYIFVFLIRIINCK